MCLHVHHSVQNLVSVCEQEPADIFFLLDKSSSLQTEVIFQKELAFVVNVIDSLDIGLGSRQSRVGVVSFSTNAQLEWGLTQFSGKSELEKTLLYIEYSRGDTYTHKAFDIMLDEFANSGRRFKQIGKVTQKVLNIKCILSETKHFI